MLSSADFMDEFGIQWSHDKLPSAIASRAKIAVLYSGGIDSLIIACLADK